jgi:hypothetical protein
MADKGLLGWRIERNASRRLEQQHRDAPMAAHAAASTPFWRTLS